MHLSQPSPSITFPSKNPPPLLTLATTITTTMSTSNPLDLEITIVSAKHLKNINWRNGLLIPYVNFYLDPAHRLATRPDVSGCSRPVWNELFTLPITRPIHDSALTLQIFHTNHTETPKPLVGTLRFPLTHLVDSDDSSQSIYTLELKRPSGRPQGKVRVKLAVRERNFQDYRNAPPNGDYYGHVSPPPARDYREFSPSPLSYSDQYSGHYPGYYSPPPPPPHSQPSFIRVSKYSATGGPSAPVDFSSSNDHNIFPSPPQTSNYGAPSGPSAPVVFSPLTSDYRAPSGPSAPVDSSSFDHRSQRGGGVGFGAGSGVGAVAGALGGLSLEEGVKYEKDKIAEREYGYGDYRRDY